ncbi:MAG: hypothetical protein LKM43_05380, partial [Wolbachia endosymbiont of Penenirmus auritus]|nr:hypothetical protein [Wolbachia endosymbiont of Penenirmus auritus]
MLGLLGGLGTGALEGRYEQKLLQRKLFEELQKEYTERQLKANELLPEEKTSNKLPLLVPVFLLK